MFFRTFPREKKVRTLAGRSLPESPAHSRPPTEAAHEVDHVESDGRWWGCQWDLARQRYCWWVAAVDGSRFGKIVWRFPVRDWDVVKVFAGSTASPGRFANTGRDMQLKFQQFYEFDFLVLQIQFIVRVLEVSVCHRQVRTVQGTVKTSQVQFLG